MYLEVSIPSFARTFRQIWPAEQGLETSSPSLPWSNWRDVPCVVVVGDPGLGKSTELKAQADALSANSVAAVYFETNNWAANHRDISEVINDAAWQRWLR